MKNHWKRNYLIENEDAVLGLPMRVTVSLVIGAVALVAILSCILNPCLFPQKMIVSVTPMVVNLTGDEPENLSFMVNVTDMNGHPLPDASVIIHGLGGAGPGFSDDQGLAIVSLQVHLQSGMHEGYLGISVSAPCHESVVYPELIKIVGSSV